MQNKNHWYRNFRFKLFVVLCVIAVLASAVFVKGPALARPAAAGDARALASSGSDRDNTFSVISRGVGKLDIFIVRHGGEIWMKSFTGSSWTNWSNLGKAANGDGFYTVSAVAAGNNRWDIFATVGGAGDQVWHKRFDGVVEYGWEGRGNVGNGWAYGIQAVSTGNGRIDLFTRGTCTSAGCGPVVRKSWSASGVWSPCANCSWALIDNNSAGAGMSFTALAHSGTRIDLFRKLDSNLAIGRKWSNNGTSWAPTLSWQGMSGGLANETPFAVSWGTNRIDVFVRGSDDNIWINNTSNAGTNWSGWNILGRGATNGTPIATAPSAVAWGPNRLDVFMREDSTVYHKAWTGTSWWPSESGGWDNIGSMEIGFFDHAPLPVSWGPNRIDLFKYEGTGSTKTLYHKWTDGNGWGPSQTTWESLGP